MGDLVHRGEYGPVRASPYRVTAHEQARAARLAVILVEMHHKGVPDSSLGWIVEDIRGLDVFESVARGDITAEDGGWLLSVQRRGFPWYVRLALWIWSRPSQRLGTGQEKP